MTYPKHLFRCPGPFRQCGVAYTVAGAADEDQEAELLANGWFSTLDEANPESIDQPATLSELRIKAKELRIKGAHLMKRATLAKRIEEALK